MKIKAIRLLGRRNSGFFRRTERTFAVYSVVWDRRVVAGDLIALANRNGGIVTPSQLLYAAPPTPRLYFTSILMQGLPRQ